MTWLKSFNDKILKQGWLDALINGDTSGESHPEFISGSYLFPA